MKPKNWVRFVLCFLIFTTLLQIAGLVSPLWIYLETDDSTVGVGLYYRIGCEARRGINCLDPTFPVDLPFGYDTTATYDKEGWVAVVWLQTISAGIAVILCVMMIVYAVGFGHWKKMNNLNFAMVVTCILAWLPCVAGLIVYAVFYGKVISRSPDVSRVSFPWSALMCFFAAIFFIIITILIHMRCRYRMYVKNAIPTSADAKMALNPSTKNQLMKRYFTPSPYREERRQALTSSAYYTDQSALISNGGFGAVEYMGHENRAFDALPSRRAIEYSMAETREDAPVTTTTSRVITNDLSSGTYAGGGAGMSTGEVNDRFKGTVYERDLGSSVRQNALQNGGTQVIERTYVTRTDVSGGSNFRDNVDRTYATATNYQRGGVEQQDTTTTTTETVVGKQTNLHRSNDYDAFSDLDAETIYYTGKEGYVPSGFLRDGGERESKYVSVIRTAGGEDRGAMGYSVRREVVQGAPPPPPPPPPLPHGEEKIIREITVVEKETSKATQENRHFRVPADVGTKDGFQRASHYTVHTRFTPDNADFSGLNLAPGLLNGDKFRYNGAYIYRPYSEEAY